MVALTVYESSLCPECQQPFDQATDPDNTFLIEDERCQACWSRESVEVTLRKAAGDKDAKLDPQAGVKVWVSGVKPHNHLREVPRGE